MREPVGECLDRISIDVDVQRHHHQVNTSDPEQKKVSLRAINCGLHVLTTTDGDEFGAAGVNWVTQGSFEPTLLVVAVKTDGGTGAMVEKTGAFALNVLGEDQLEIGKAFFRSTTVEGDTINGYRFERAPETGCPLLVDLPYWFEARVTDRVARGDHTIFVGEVVGAGVRDAAVTPMLLRSTGMNYGG